MFLDDDRRFEPDLLFIQTPHLDRLGETALKGFRLDAGWLRQHPLPDPGDRLSAILRS